jgi:response regulator RpfG family c-di-GMP phosphodiesterase
MPKQCVAYEDGASVEQEMPRARDSKHNLDKVVESMVQDIQVDKKVDADSIKPAVHDMVESVIRNGLSRDQLQELGLAGLLFDVGKLKLPPNLLSKPGKLTDEEYALVSKHVDYGVEILSQSSGISPKVIDGVRHHHERHDGSGYPQGLRNGEIPIYSRIVAIVDCFDAITSARPFRESISAHHAIRQMYDWRDKEFQAQLYEQFIQCLGVYPTGTIVELSSGEIAIVVAQNRTRRLRPRVMLVLDEEKVALERNSILDLGDELPGPGERSLEIVNSHDTGAFGIDPRRYFA